METDRLIVRNFKLDDWKDMYEYLSDPKVIKYEPYDVQTKESCKKMVEERLGDESFWVATLKESGKVIGNIYLGKQRYDSWEMGYIFNGDYQRKGYASEAAGAVIDNAILNCGAHRIVADCNPENKASWRLMERLGMRKEGHQVQNLYFRKNADGTPIWQDSYNYAILKNEWMAIK